MLQKKKNLLEKIVKKDYNNELEEVLETKQFDENVKSTLLGILYKIEAAYKDLETVKRDVQTKDEYVTNIIEIIKNNCDSIKIVNMSDEENKIYEYTTKIELKTGGNYGYTFRVMPKHEMLLDSENLNLVKWITK